MRIAIVNDSGVAVEALRRVVVKGGHTIAWIARDGADAVARAATDRPDLVLMDLRMPVMDGVECTRRLMATSPCAILIVTATVSGSFAQVYDAMGAGALDAIDTPVLAGTSVDGEAMLLEKIARIALLTGNPNHTPPAGSPTARAPGGDTIAPLVAIGSSTGGPDALVQLLGAIPVGTRAAIVIVQHVDKDLAAGLASWLAQRTGHTARTIVDGDAPTAGVVHVAATDDHVVIDAKGCLTYTRNPKRNPYRPSVDVFFHSLAERWPVPASAVILTGMGRDGAEGMLALHRAGWMTAAQDEASCVVYGMPRAAIELGAAAHIQPPRAIGELLASRLGRRASVGP